MKDWAKRLRDLSAELLRTCPEDDVAIDDPEVTALLASVKLELQAAREEVSDLQLYGDLPFMTLETLQNMAEGGGRLSEEATRAMETAEKVREWRNAVFSPDDDECSIRPLDAWELGPPRFPDVRAEAAWLREQAKTPVDRAFRRFRSALKEAKWCSSYTKSVDALRGSVEMGNPGQEVAQKTVEKWARRELFDKIDPQSPLTTPSFDAAIYLLSTESVADERNKEACRRFVEHVLDALPSIPKSYIGRGRQEREYLACQDLTRRFVSFVRAPGFPAVVSGDHAADMKRLWASYIIRCGGSTPVYTETVIAGLLYRCAFGAFGGGDEESDPLENMLARERSTVNGVAENLRVPFPSKIPKRMIDAIEKARYRVNELRDGLKPDGVTDMELEMKRYIDVWGDVMSTIETKGKKRRAAAAEEATM